jgi:hypothetical protein
MRRDAGCGSAKKFVTPRCTVTANDINFGFRLSDRDGQIVKQVKHASINLENVTGAMIPQKAVQTNHGRGNVTVASSINHVKPFVGVRMVEPQSVFRLRRCSSLCSRRRQAGEPKEQNEAAKHV